MKTILIDGYNLLHKATHLIPAHLDLHGQRSHLIHLLSNFARQRQVSLLIVFDNRSEQHRPAAASPAARGVKIIFTPAGKDADTLIQEHIRQHAARKELTVVSSDHEIQNTARDHGCTILKSEAFARQLRGSSPSRKSGKVKLGETGEKTDTHLSQKEIDYWKAMFEQGRDDENQ